MLSLMLSQTVYEVFCTINGLALNPPSIDFISPSVLSIKKGPLF